MGEDVEAICRRSTMPLGCFTLSIDLWGQQPECYLLEFNKIGQPFFPYVPDVAYPEDWGAKGKLVWDEEVGRE